jgi:Calcineurin-like phosphoesterase
MEEIKWQVGSDIHLEFYDKHDKGRITPEVFLSPSAHNLALCGDIGYPERPAYRAFIDWCSRNYELVVVTSGNHEYYSVRKTPNEIDQMIYDICKRYPNVHYLQKGVLQTPKARILGCTLWSHISPQNRYKAAATMNDYHKIMNWSVDSCRAKHADHVSWLEKEIAYAAEHNEPTIVLTHHLPSYELIHSTYKDHDGNYNFASHLDRLLKHPVEAWFAGHTHKGVDMALHGVRCVVNPFGYPHENKTTDIRKKYVSLTLPERTSSAPPLRPKTPPPIQKQDDYPVDEDYDFA